MITVVGSLNQDIVAKVPRHPRPGETVLGSEHFVAPGGKGANQAIAAARLGRSVAMVGRVGDDDAGRTLLAGLVAEIVLTFFFLMIILGATDSRAPAGFAPLAIGLGLTLIHLIGIPVTNLSVNLARSTGPALFVGGWALQQLWLFWVAPLIGAAIAGAVYRWFEE